MNNLENIRTIEKYLDEQLSDQEMMDIEVRMLVDDKYRQEFETFRLLRHGIIGTARETSLSEKLDRLKKWSVNSRKNKTRQEPRKIKVNINRSSIKKIIPLAIAASVLILVAIPILIQRPVPPQQLFAKYFEPSKNFGPQIVRSGDKNDPIQMAYLSYDLGDYELAITLFERHLKEDVTHRLTDLYHLGNCYLATGQWDSAIQALEEVSQSENPLSENAKWYLALAYLQVDDMEKTKTLLREVAAPLDIARQARSLYRKLK